MKEKKEVVATAQQKERVTVKERITYWKGKIREAKRESIEENAMKMGRGSCRSFVSDRIKKEW